MIMKAYRQQYVGYEDALAIHSHAPNPQSDVTSILIVSLNLHQNNINGFVNDKGVEERVGDPLDEDEV